MPPAIGTLLATKLLHQCLMFLRKQKVRLAPLMRRGMTSRGCTPGCHAAEGHEAFWEEGVALIGRTHMRKTLHEISKEYGIPPATLRSAIFRRKLRAEKVGGIRMIDDEGTSFQHYLLTYAPRGDDLFDDPLVLERVSTSSMHDTADAANQSARTT
jgi:hypothetical protein